MKITDVTNEVEFGDNDANFMPIDKCICGHKSGYWNFVISTESDDSNKCPNCGAKFYFTIKINVYQVED